MISVELEKGTKCLTLKEGELYTLDSPTSQQSLYQKLTLLLLLSGTLWPCHFRIHLKTATPNHIPFLDELQAILSVYRDLTSREKEREQYAQRGTDSVRSEVYELLKKTVDKAKGEWLGPLRAQLVVAGFGDAVHLLETNIKGEEPK